MNARTQVEVVMECNIRARAQVNPPVWAPCATSTPVRKPLIILNNAEVTGARKCGSKKPKAACGVLPIDWSEGKRPLENVSKNTVKKKLNKIGRTLHYLEDDDDSEDENEDGQSNKHLIIKSGSSQMSKRSVRKQIDVTKTENANKQWKHGILYDAAKPAKTVDNKTERNDEKKPAICLEQVCSTEDFGKDSKVKITNLNKSDSNSNEGSKSENCIVKLPNMQNTVSLNNDVNGISDGAQQKRKKQYLKTNVKKLKSESYCSSPSLKMNDNNKARTIKNKMKSFRKIGRTFDRIKQDNVSRLSVSHEIFSDSKEKELRDSLNLTADDDELSVNVSNENQSVTMQKNLSKQKTESEHLGRFEACDNTQLSRPKRERKSPKEFWLPRAEKISKPPNDNNDCNNDEIIIPSETTTNKQKDMADSVSASSKVGDGNLPSEKVYIKNISEMEFVENSATEDTKKFSVALGWQFSSFKCCVLKIGAKCEASGRTKSNNSHFGGIILKGRLSMKIGETEVKMKGGQMFHVPPLRDWRAVNIGRIDCVLYYWVGKL